MFDMSESMQLGNFIAQKLNRPPNSMDEISRNLEKYFGLKTHPERMADFGMWSLNTVVNEEKILTDPSIPSFLKEILNNPKRIYENYDKRGKFKIQ